MLPNDNIEQVRKVKSEKETRRDTLKMRIGLIVTVSGLLVMVLILVSVWLFADGNFSRLNLFYNSNSEESLIDSSFEENSLGEEKLLIIVNTNSKLPDDYEISTEKYEGVEIAEEAYDALKLMISEAAKSEITLSVSSGYISLLQQDQIYSDLYNSLIAKGYSKVKAENEASPYKSGYCEQNTGLSVMFDGGNDFNKTKEYNWLSEHCVEYGFVLRFPENKESETGVSYEPKLFRFVGKENAVNMRKFGMCLEEYAEYLAQR